MTSVSDVHPKDTQIRTTPGVSRTLLYRRLWIPVLLVGTFLLLTAALLVGVSWHSLQRLAPIQTHVRYLSELQQVGLQIQELLHDANRRTAPPDAREFNALHRAVQALARENGSLAPTAREYLRDVDKTLTENRQLAPSGLSFIQKEWARILALETQAHRTLLQDIESNAKTELEFSLVIVFAIPLLALLSLLLLRRRILLPLKDLGFLMNRLALQDYRSIPTEDVDPLVRPLFHNYNRMVNRLAELEREHRARHESLEYEIRTATTALLEQQRSLAKAERLAAMGEIAAGLAHELRNPLAGVQMALANLRGEIHDSEHVERLDLVINTLKRTTQLLNNLLEQSRHKPEPLAEVRLPEVIAELLALVRYQVPPPIRLEQKIPPALRCRLPEGQFRQALLNLVLNAAQAIGESPGIITVRVTLNGPRLDVSVCDDGPGFPPDLLDAGIRTFAAWRDHGTGLGLAMVRRFARDLGGELRLANTPPHGACATLDIPCGASNG